MFSEPGKAEMGPAMMPGMQPVFFYAVPVPVPLAQQGEMQYMPQMAPMPQMLQITQNAQVLDPRFQEISLQQTEPTAVQIAGNVWHLAREKEGCRLVQEALENAAGD